MRNFKVNTVGGSYEMSDEDVEYLKNEIQDFDNLVIIHYERPTSFGSAISSKPFKLHTYACGELPEGIDELVNKFDERQQSLFKNYWSKLGNNINFAGTQIYYTHVKVIAILHEIAKRISQIKTNEDFFKEMEMFSETEYKCNKFFTYTHIVQDILEQLKKE